MPVKCSWSLKTDACDAATVFATVADIERYSEFLPLYARVLERDGARMRVENRFQVGSLVNRFTSEPT